MNNSRLGVLYALTVMLLLSTVAASGLSVQLKRTNPGIAGQKSAELIFDIVNTDFANKIEGFLWCNSPDDAVVSSTMGVASGSGAQYLSPRFTMDTGPAQKSISLTMSSDSAGDKRTGCTVKYAPYVETVGEPTEVTRDISYDGSITKTITTVSDVDVSLVSFVPGTEKTENQSAVPAKAIVKVENAEQEIAVGESKLFGDLTVEVLSASAESANVKITGTVAYASDPVVSKRYIKMNGEFAEQLTDDQYREIRLDKTIPFVNAPADAEVSCPEGKTTCGYNEVQVVSAGPISGIPTSWLVVVLIGVVLVVAYLMGKSSSGN